MLSVIIQNKFSYSAMLIKQPIHQWFTLLGPLVLELDSCIFQNIYRR